MFPVTGKEEFPRLVFCIPRARASTWKLYRNLEIMFYSEDGEYVTKNFTYEPTIFDIRAYTGVGWDTFYGLCMHHFTWNAQLRWNGVPGIDAFLTAQVSEEAVIGYQRIRITNTSQLLQINVLGLSRFDKGDRHLEQYPPHLWEEDDDVDNNNDDNGPGDKRRANRSFPKNMVYDQNMCSDRCIHKESKKLNISKDCRETHRLLRAQMLAAFQPDWESIFLNDLCESGSSDETDPVFVFPNYKLCELKGSVSVQRSHCDATQHAQYAACRQKCDETRRSDDFNFEFFFLDEEEMATQECPSPPDGVTVVYIQNNAVKKQTTTLKPRVSFEEGVGLVGGYLGFFIGASLISIMEGLHFLVEIICLKCGVNGKKKKSSVKTLILVNRRDSQ